METECRDADVTLLRDAWALDNYDEEPVADCEPADDCKCRNCCRYFDPLLLVVCRSCGGSVCIACAEGGKIGNTICIECYLIIPPTPDGSYDWEGAEDRVDSEAPALSAEVGGPPTPLLPGTPPDWGGSVVSSSEELGLEPGQPGDSPPGAEPAPMHDWTDAEEPEHL
jgi:hypothetical protein